MPGPRQHAWTMHPPERESVRTASRAHPSGWVSLVANVLLALALVGASLGLAHSEVQRAIADDRPDTFSDASTTGALRPDLAQAVAAAQTQAEHEGVPLVVTSGWRSETHQQRLLDEAVTRNGSLEEALRWVARPRDSRHVTGEAVDVGPPSGAQWLDQHGAAFGLCRIFDNETWHFELATEPGGSCPPRWADNAARPSRGW
jgi:D-alanyl-D-alanine carboxypeptidase